MIKQIPNLFTSLNLIVGCVGVYSVLAGGEFRALYFVLAAAFFDVFDGLLARLLKAKSDFGAQLDSLADLISFGVLPSFYLLGLLKGQVGFYWVALLVALFSAYRLARFNIDDSQSDSFLGLPVPANAIMITSLFLAPFELGASALMVVVAASCVLLVSPIRLLSLKFSNFGWSGNQTRWILIFGSVAFFLVFGWMFVPFLIPYYILLSVVSSALIKKGNA